MQVSEGVFMRRSIVTRSAALLLLSGLIACADRPSIEPATSTAQPQAAQQRAPLTAEELTRRTIERRAVEAAIWGMPMVSVDAIRQAIFRDAGANYNYRP